MGGGGGALEYIRGKLGGLEKIYSPWGGGGGAGRFFLMLVNFPPAHPYA